ncbi:hypothetical protein CULC22_01236 [Corynebacterium ulcerans BR-AD22]|nr:hypothetical protein CULC22_01236 [Corynebacterium ulcerans BR-AD22]
MLASVDKLHCTMAQLAKILCEPTELKKELYSLDHS